MNSLNLILTHRHQPPTCDFRSQISDATTTRRGSEKAGGPTRFFQANGDLVGPVAPGVVPKNPQIDPLLS